MLPEHVLSFLTENHQRVLTTFRKRDTVQVSVASCGLYGEGAAFTTTADRAKIPNLRRDPRCTLLVSQADWRGYVTLEGHAQFLSPENTDAEELRLALRGAQSAEVSSGGRAGAHLREQGVADYASLNVPFMSSWSRELWRVLDS
jgi:hypothetical protein